MNELNLPAYDVKLRGTREKPEILDFLRRRYVALTPEEWVRQHVIHALHSHQGYPLELMQVEGAITLNGMTRRCDIVVYGRAVRPMMIVECKQADVPLTQKVLDQASRYNLVLQVPYLYVTNGMQHIVCQVDAENKCLTQLARLPSWETLCAD